MALLHKLKASASACGFSLSAVNCEHGIRGEDSLADTLFVKETCERWGVPLYMFSADCPAEAAREKISLETAARNFRYRSFDSLLKENKADFIATAHHLGDEAETVLFRLCRGTSLSGAKGMEAEREGYIRPFLGLSKSEILDYVWKNGVPFREDATNAEREITRNRLRMDVLPELEAAVPGAAGNLARFAKIAAEDDELLYELSEPLIERRAPGTAGDTGFRLLFSDKAPLFRRACLAVLKELGVERDYTFLHLDGVFRLQNLQTGSRLSLPGGLEAERVYDRIVFYRKAANALPFEAISFREGTFEAGRYEIIVSARAMEDGKEGTKILSLDGDRLPADAVFRTRRSGDSFEKFGGGRKTLKKYLTDKKVPQAVREELPVLAESAGSEVFAVCGVEISDKVKLTADTRRPFYIKIQRKEEKHR